jgi:transcription-repair coupling factor (superfamily II helicase)
VSRSTHLPSIVGALQRHPQPLAIAAALSAPGGRTSIKNLHGSARSLLLAAISAMSEYPLVILTADDRQTQSFAHDLRQVLPPGRVASIQLTQRQSSLQSGTSLHHEHVDALARLASGEVSVVVVGAPFLTRSVPIPQRLKGAMIHLAVGQEIGFDDIAIELAMHGFERQDFVGNPGDFSVRGGIIDIFPAGWDNPLRFEFWGNVLESIREFEPLSQRSIRDHTMVDFVGEVFHDDDSTLTASIVDYLPADAIIAHIEPEAVLSVLADEATSAAVQALTAFRTLHINPLGSADHSATSSVQPAVNASVEQLVRLAGSLLRRNLTVWMGANGQKNIERLRDLCDAMADNADADDEELAAGYHRTIAEVQWSPLTVSEGFVWNDVGLAVLTEHETFGRQRAQDVSRRSRGTLSMRDLRQLHRGEYVVHEDKGVGQFEGLHTITIGGSQQECVKLLFKGGDVLYVHLNYVHKLSKFAAEEGALPVLSKLGSGDWERKKAKAKRKIKDIARDLILLYAKRKLTPGFAFPTDSVWQRELEASFQYEDTPDQARSTLEVKVDMESATPMDRLVCGDVGFGKTEIAVRAAFKAAQAGKQVAVLVPTTILAQQHFVTFRDRLQRYPVRVDVLSRFRSRAEQKDILAAVTSGSVDIVVGTHRLLSKDVQFKNLGLLIIDEEHRFGVGAKEKLRSLRANLDTLTLTATPIPRTLNFSLMGARDLSVIETPPRNRLPIITEILQWNDDVLRQALLDELDRGGQVFVVTDKIGEMDRLMQRLLMLVPSIRPALAHGQMDTEVLEDVMEGFLERRFDVLIATKIIESGLDIPNANTIIIHNADNFGLAELYQLRGRVGRSNAQAYCYLVIPPAHTLSRIALRRLQALEEYTDLGSGFQLAMRDLEIRGAGNLLGGEQSGFITDMGFELYHKILDEAVEELRHEEFADLFGPASAKRSFANQDVAIELDVDALLPSSYIPTDTDRYEAYKTLYNASEERIIDGVYAELRDRYGPLPAEAEALFYAVRMRIAAMPTGVVRVNLNNSRLLIELPPDTNTDFYDTIFPRILPFTVEVRNVKFVQQGKRLLISIDLDEREKTLPMLELFRSYALHTPDTIAKATS